MVDMVWSNARPILQNDPVDRHVIGFLLFGQLSLTLVVKAQVLANHIQVALLRQAAPLVVNGVAGRIADIGSELRAVLEVGDTEAD